MAVTVTQKRAQNLQVGPNFDKVTGLAAEGIEVAPLEDRGAAVQGIQGDVMLEIFENNAYTITVNLLSDSTGVDLLVDMQDLGVFPLKFELGRANIEGLGVIMNEGTTSGAKGTQTKVVTIAAAKTIGKLKGIGLALTT